MTTQNPLGIDFAAITHSAEKRAATLESIGNVIANNVAEAHIGLDVLRTMYGELIRLYQELDSEGRHLLPREVKDVLNGLGNDMSHLDGVLGNTHPHNRTPGLIDLLPYAKIDPRNPTDVPGTPKEDNDYTIKIVIESERDCESIAADIQAIYDNSNVAGYYKVESSVIGDANNWRWITFTRSTDEDSHLLLERIDRSGFTIDTRRAAIDQFKAEITEPGANGDIGRLVELILDALDKAEVKFG